MLGLDHEQHGTESQNGVGLCPCQAQPEPGLVRPAVERRGTQRLTENVPLFHKHWRAEHG